VRNAVEDSSKSELSETSSLSTMLNIVTAYLPNTIDNAIGRPEEPPPAAVANVTAPEPSVVKTWLAVPSAVGRL
jgi:hypothetical protein